MVRFRTNLLFKTLAVLPLEGISRRNNRGDGAEIPGHSISRNIRFQYASFVSCHGAKGLTRIARRHNIMLLAFER